MLHPVAFGCRRTPEMRLAYIHTWVKASWAIGQSTNAATCSLGNVLLGLQSATQSNSSYHTMVAIPLSFGCKCASCAGIWTSSTGMIIGSQTPTTSPILAPTCASTHISKITSKTLIFFNAATPLFYLSLWNPKTCRIFAAVASLIPSPRNWTPLLNLPGLHPTMTPTTVPTRHLTPPSLLLAKQDSRIFLTWLPNLPSLPSSIQNHSTLLTGQLLLATQSNLTLLPGDACTTQNSPMLQNQSLTLTGLFMGSTVDILYLPFGLLVFPSILHFQPTLLSTEALSSLNSTPPHL